jgi:hypothetical protein
MVMLMAVFGADDKAAHAAMEHSCSCDDPRASGALHQAPNVPVEFRPLLSKENVGVSYKRPRGSSIIARRNSETSLRRNSRFDVNSRDGSCSSSQVHLSLGDDARSAVVSFASKDASTPSLVEVFDGLVEFESPGNDFASLRAKTKASRLFYGLPTSYSEIMYMSSYLTTPPLGDAAFTKEEVVKLENTASWAFDHVTGEHWFNYRNVTVPYTGLGQYNNPYLVYDSPVLHTVTLDNLVPGKHYFYRVGGSCEVFGFTLPRAAPSKSVSLYPFTFGVSADVGQTNVSIMSIDAISALQPDVVLLPGDLSYADGWPGLWDSFGELFQRLAARYPVLTTGGNHEIGSAEAWQSYRLRYPTPFRQSGSTHFCYWGKEVGPVHILALCSYAGYSESSSQYAWLANHLSTSVDRQRTPWLVAMMHVPFYSSNAVHWMEGELMRQSMEKLFFDAGVDIVFAGHVHAYERTYPVYDNQLNPCGPIYVTLGDGGNYEGPATSWRMESDTETNAPIWSAFREGSFGVAGLELQNDTHATYSWHRHACGEPEESGTKGIDYSANCTSPGDGSSQAMLTVDVANFVRPSSRQCPNKWMSSAMLIPLDKSMLRDSGSIDFESFMDPDLFWQPLHVNGLAGVLGILVIVLVGANIFLITQIKSLKRS